jgi:glutaminyl-peptide cyclotransferase
MAGAAPNPTMTPRIFRASLLILFLIGCAKEETRAPEQPSLPPIPSKPVPAFNAERAFADVEKLVAFGPRVPNTPAHAAALEFLRQELAATTSQLQLQAFTAQAYDNTQLELTNLVASFNPEATDRIMILTHWDSRPWADLDPDPKNRTKPVPAANDGGSGTAVLLELARAMKESAPPIGVDLLLDDGEDYGISDSDDLNRYFLGAKYFVKTKPAGYNPRFAILLDMVGDKDAQFLKEGHSLERAGAFTNEVWKAASDLGLSTFRQMRGDAISDDHTPFLDAGIPAVDIIDIDLVGNKSPDPRRRYWHTIDDLPKHLSPNTMGEVGKLLLYLIYDRLPKTIRTL